MEVVIPHNHNELQMKRVSKRKGLSFHIFGGYVKPHTGGYGDDQEATDNELSMWSILMPDEWVGIDLQNYINLFVNKLPPLNSYLSEIEDFVEDYSYHKLCYMHSDDFTVLSKSVKFSYKENNIGAYGDMIIYSVLDIPKGYIWFSHERVEWFHLELETRPPMSDYIKSNILFASECDIVKPIGV